MATVAAGVRGDRIVTLDVIRGIAVMGIFSVNVVGMAMIEAAYFEPPAFGFDGFHDKLTYAANFLLVDGKMRSLFSMLFGASALLVIERAIAGGRSAAKTHYARMATLLLFGLIHYYLFWWGDILTGYALIGMVMFLFRTVGTKWLLIWAVALLAIDSVRGAVFMTMGLDQSQPASLAPSAQMLAEDAAAHQTLASRARYAFSHDPLRPFFGWAGLLPETLGLMLLGMAGLRSGFLTGEWADRTYRRIAAWGLGAGLLVSAVSLHFVVESDYAGPYLSAARNGWTAPLRPVMALGYAALIILLFRRRSAMRDRFAAVGRTAFSNYLGCTLVGTFVFFGFAGDLYGDVSRGEAWLLVPPVWAAMLLWSKLWLDRFNYGPLEWAWRSLSQGRAQPMRKSRD